MTVSLSLITTIFILFIVSKRLFSFILRTFWSSPPFRCFVKKNTSFFEKLLCMPMHSCFVFVFLLSCSPKVNNNQHNNTYDNVSIPCKIHILFIQQVYIFVKIRLFEVNLSLYLIVAMSFPQSLRRKLMI